MFRWIATLGCLAILVTGCTDSSMDNGVTGSGEKLTGEDVQREIGEAADTTAKYTDQKKDEYVHKMKEQLKEMDEEIAKLEVKADELSEDAKVEWDEQLARLKEKRQVADKKLDELQASSADAWKEFRNDAENAWSDLSEAFDDAAAQLE